VSGSNDPSAFLAAVDQWEKDALEWLRLQFISVCLDAAAGVIEKTPVDTGFCRASWSISINSLPGYVIRNPRDDGGESLAKLSKRARKSFAGPSAAEGGKFSSDPAYVMSALVPAKIGDVVYIYNPVVYAQRLEHGHSKQAPAGMVGVTLAELEAKHR
jgi:hypothetical protein